ncbi:DUF305 domain-containing protein [Actinomycetes bacterium KLBMP 9797]
MTRVITLRRFVFSGTAALATLVLAAGCGGGDDMGGMSHGGTVSPSAAATPAASFNDADVRFAQMMIPHHQQAVEMATLAGSRASDPQVKQLAAQVKAAQDPEINTMTGWLTAWGQSTAAPGGGHDMPGMSSMPGMMSDEEMAKLEATEGAEFDRMFTRMMIAHHNGAIQMAKDEQQKGASPEAKALAATIEKTQTEEVTKLEAILDRM